MKYGNGRIAALLLTGLAVGCACAGEAPAPKYQWSVTVPRPEGKTCTAYVWIPPAAERVRGVLIGGEPSIAEDAAIRQACAAEQLAVIRAGIDGMFNYKTGSGPEVFLKVLEAAAAATGYREIANAPFFTFGHSTSCNYASAAPCWKPTRCFGTLVFKGGLVIPSYDPEADISGIPILAIKGQFEEFGPGPSGVLRDFEDRETGWKCSRDQYLRLREKNERLLISLLVEAGTTHMAWSPRDGEYTALFIRKAAQARIPDWPVDAAEPVKCREIDHTAGALTSTAITAPHPAQAALYRDYKGNKQSAYWHVDLELAQACDAFHTGRFNKRTQFVTFADTATGKTLVSSHDLRFSVPPTYVGPDTIKVAGVFLMEVRDKYAVPEPPLGHAEGPILFRLFGGNVEQAGPDTFRVRGYGERGASAAVVAYHPGDAQYRYAEQPANIRLPPLTKGKPQKLTFPPVGGLKPDSPPVKLAATSDSGLPVCYVVLHGPAVIEGDTLKVTGIPKRAKLPMQVVVGACQWGSGVEPFVQTAEPVIQTLAVGQ